MARRPKRKRIVRPISPEGANPISPEGANPISPKGASSSRYPKRTVRRIPPEAANLQRIVLPKGASSSRYPKRIVRPVSPEGASSSPIVRPISPEGASSSDEDGVDRKPCAPGGSRLILLPTSEGTSSSEDDETIWARISPERPGEGPDDYLKRRMQGYMEKNGIFAGSLASDKGPPPTSKKSKKRRVTYENDVEDFIPPIGFTRLEYKTMSEHMIRQDFELYEPLSKKQRRMKTYLDQIRETRGYGVTIFEPPPGRTYSRIAPIAKTWKKDSMLKFYIPSMVETLRVAMENKFRVRFRNMEQELARNLEVARNLELTNGVKCSNVRVYLLSFGTPKIPTDGNVVEAMFSLEGDPVVGKPVVSPTNFVLEEWKLKRGEHLVYSSTLTSGGMKEFSLRFNTAIRRKQVC